MSDSNWRWHCVHLPGIGDCLAEVRDDVKPWCAGERVQCARLCVIGMSPRGDVKLLKWIPAMIGAVNRDEVGYISPTVIYPANEAAATKAEELWNPPRIATPPNGRLIVP